MLRRLFIVFSSVFTFSCAPLGIFMLSALLLGGAAHAAAPDTEATWWKGNLHTHTFWTDGNDYPEMIADWYKEHGYHFLGLSDHNGLQDTERWMDVTGKPYNIKDRPTHEEILKRYIERFGADWVEQRKLEGKSQVRLKKLNEFRPRLEEPGRFLLLPSEEISADPLHVNATNIRFTIEQIRLPETGLREILQTAADTVLAQRQATGQPMFLHLNHPGAIAMEALAEVKAARFFEIYNTGAGLDLDREWDITLTRRVAELGMEPVFGLATDDSHQYQLWGIGNQNPGGGWVMVRAKNLTPGALVAALEAGDFYASSGVTLKKLDRNACRISFEIAAEPGVTYTTRFIGTRKGYAAPILVTSQEHPAMKQYRGTLPALRYGNDIGVTLAEVEGSKASYILQGDDLYVRAKIVSSKEKTNGLIKGALETAWIQPLVNGSGQRCR